MSDETQKDQPQNESVETETPADNLPENIVDVEDAGTLRKKVTVTIDRQRIDAKLDEMFGELASSAQVPGFRVGRAPRRLIEKRFGREVSGNVRNALIGESIGQAIETAELKTLGEPDIDLEKIELPEKDNMTFSFEVEVAPEFDLPELKDIPVTKTVAEVDDARIDEQLEQWQQSQAQFVASEEPAAEGDVVTADVTITGDDVDLHRKDVPMRVAPGQVEGVPLVDLADALSGKKAGETAEMTVTVPDAHPNEEWRGKELTVAVTPTQIRKREVSPIDDDLAKRCGFESLDDLRQFVGQNLQQRLAADTQRDMRQQVSDYLLANTEFELPEGVAARHAANALRRRYIELLQMGMPREKIDENLAQLQAAATEQAQKDLKLQFILGKIADQSDVEVSEDEVNSAIAAMARQYNRRPERLRQELTNDGSLGQVEQSIREDKVIDLLLEDAKVTEAAPEEKPAKEAKPKAKKADKSEKKDADEKKPAAKKTAKKAAAKTDDGEKKPAAKKTAKKKASKKSDKE